MFKYVRISPMRTPKKSRAIASYLRNPIISLRSIELCRFAARPSSTDGQSSRFLSFPIGQLPNPLSVAPAANTALRRARPSGLLL